MTKLRNLISDVPGVCVGHAADMKAGSGVTAIVFDEPSIASVDLRGGGTGTREVALLDPGATVERIDAIALSGGERRRVEIARALATHPSYILLDEPLAGIDPIAVGEIRDLVRHLKDRGIGVLITDHNVRDALDVIDRAYILHDGRVLKEGTPAEIVNDRDVRRVYLGEKFSL